MAITQRAANIILSEAKIYFADTETAFITPQTAFGSAWPNAWTYVGYTNAPTAIRFTRETVDIEVEQALGVVRRDIIRESLELETTLVEITAENLALVWGGTASTTAPAAGPPAVPGYDSLYGGGSRSLPEKMWGLEGRTRDKAGNVFPVRYFIREGVAAFGSELQFAKETPAGLTLRVVANHVTEEADEDPIAEGQQLFYWYRVNLPAPA